MKNRKSPTRHRVEEHKRGDSKVKSYMRGVSALLRKPTVTIPRHRKSKKPKAWTINFKYSDKKDDGESFLVIAPNYERALDEAYEEKTDPRDPIEFSVIDPSIGEIVRYIGKGAKRATKVGAKYALMGGKAVAKKAGTVAVARLRDEIAKDLIKKAYSEDRPTRIIARSRLKVEYPDVYNIMDFSRRSYRRI